MVFGAEEVRSLHENQKAEGPVRRRAAVRRVPENSRVSEVRVAGEGDLSWSQLLETAACQPRILMRHALNSQS